MQILETAIARYTIRDDGILVTRGINPEAPRTRESAIATLNALAGFMGEEPRPALWDQRATPRLDPQVWTAVIERIEQLAVALAFLTDEGTSRKLGSFPDVMGTLLIPTRRFTDEESAIAWLQQFLD